MLNFYSPMPGKEKDSLSYVGIIGLVKFVVHRQWRLITKDMLKTLEESQLSGWCHYVENVIEISIKTTDDLLISSLDKRIFLALLERTLIACPCPRILKPFAAQLRSGFFISHRSQTSLDRCKMKKPLILR